MASRSVTRWRALAGLLRADRGRWCSLGVLVAAASALSLVGPLIVRTIVDRGDGGTTVAAITALALGYLAVAVVGQVTAVAVAWFATHTAWRTTNELRMTMTAHVLGLDHEFHRSHTPGDLIQRVDGDVTSVSDFLGRVVPHALGALLTTLGMLVVLTVVDWRIATGMAVYLAIAVVLVVLLRHRAVTEAADEMGTYANLYGGIEERLTAGEDLRANGAGHHAMWRFTEESAAVARSALRRERAFLRLWWVVQSSFGFGSALALAVGGWLVAREPDMLGTAFLLLQYVQLINRPLEHLVEELETVQKANGAMVRVMDLLAVRPEIVDNGSVLPAPGALSVDCAGVSFDYGDDEAVLSDVNVTLAAGRTVGVIGRTGSGKTTFARLVLRLVEPTSGVLSLGGVPISALPFGELRRRVALIPQEVELLAGSIRDNVTLFDPAPTEAEVVDALTRAGLDALVEGGIDRELGAGGSGISAGEAQLLSLARVWLRRPDLIVLDEPTARVDPETEARIDAAVRRLTAGRTTLIIAHRLSTLAAADDICVFDQGRVVEFGERAALAADPASRYRRLLDLALDDLDVGADVALAPVPTEDGAAPGVAAARDRSGGDVGQGFDGPVDDAAADLDPRSDVVPLDAIESAVAG